MSKLRLALSITGKHCAKTIKEKVKMVGCTKDCECFHVNHLTKLLILYALKKKLQFKFFSVILISHKFAVV